MLRVFSVLAHSLVYLFVYLYLKANIYIILILYLIFIVPLNTTCPYAPFTIYYVKLLLL